MQYYNSHTTTPFVEVSLPIYLVHPKPYKHLIITVALRLHLLHFYYRPASCKNFLPKNALTQEFSHNSSMPYHNIVANILLQTYYNNQIHKTLIRP
jgi:hypothetical protein